MHVGETDLSFFPLLNGYSSSRHISISETCFKNVNSTDGFMNLFKKIERNLTILVMSPLVELDKKERERKLNERLKRIEEKHNRR